MLPVEEKIGSVFWHFAFQKWALPKSFPIDQGNILSLSQDYYLKSK
jgi:hypothetical protein